MTHTFLLEVGLEDMPADIVQSAENQLVEKTKTFLADANLSFEEVTGYSTPRRFTVMVDGLADKQPNEELTVRGPALRIAQDEEGNWTKAATGFSKGQGGSVDDLTIKDEKGEPYIYMEKNIEGKSAFEILRGMGSVVKAIEFPKNMKWGTGNDHYVRPIHWLVALLDEEVVPFDVFGIETSRQTQGHRFLGQAIELHHPGEYEEKLEKESVIASRPKRKGMIVEQLTALCREKHWEVPVEYEDLLEEVTDLVEYPTVFYGEFDASYLAVPEVVLETSMIDHQRYFPVREANKDNKLLPYFISVRNGNDKHIENVSRGNEKVLSARLADAKFFYGEDQKNSIEAFNDQLKRVDYHDQLGTIHEKENRAVKMVPVVARFFHLTDEETKELSRIASIYKFDLVTQVVDEFPNLQGKIGEIYAAERGESQEVSSAIGEQYLPLSVSDELPQTKLGKLISLIDKMDALIQFFSVGLIPTGSNDPYALRRQAIGVVRLLLDVDKQAVEIDDFVDELIKASDIPAERGADLAENEAALIAFIKDRLEQIMQSEYGIAHDVRQAALGSTHQNLNWNLEVAQVLEAEKESEEFKLVVESLTRVINMTRYEGQTGEVDETLLETVSEKELAKEVVKLEEHAQNVQNSKQRFDALKDISPFITEFFDQNMVMVDDESVKENRLTLLNNLANMAEQFADFTQLTI